MATRSLQVRACQCALAVALPLALLLAHLTAGDARTLRGLGDKWEGARPATHVVGGDSNKSTYGLVTTLVASRVPSDTTCDTRPICKLEYAGRFEEAFEAYERIILACGESGWVTFAELGKGETALVLLRKTPCGTFVAMKMPNTGVVRATEVANISAVHIARDCAVLKRLSPFLLDPTCQGCFPRYYYYSPVTGICYSEHVQAVPMGKFLTSQAKPSSPPDEESFANLKLALTQALDAVAILKANDIVHRDLLTKNMLVRLQPGAQPPFRVVIMDFCSFTSIANPVRSSQYYGHFTRTPDSKINGWEDSYAVACNFAAYFYCRSCIGMATTKCFLEPEVQRNDTQALEYPLWRMTHPAYADRMHDIELMKALIAVTTHM